MQIGDNVLIVKTTIKVPPAMWVVIDTAGKKQSKP